MTLIDEAAFTRALREAFPGVEFWDRGHLDRKVISQLVPALHMARTLSVEAEIPRPGWTPRIGEMDDEGCWRYAPVESISIFRSVWDWTANPGKWACDPPLLQDGYIGTSYRKDDAFGRDCIERLWRKILPNVATYFRNCTWVGHDALRWASESPRRMIDGYLRPPEGWTFETLRPAKRKYYEGLDAMRSESDPRPPPEMYE